MFDSNSNANSQDLPNQFSQVDHDNNQSPSNSFLNFPSQFLDDDALFLGAVLPYQSPPRPPPTMEDSGEQRVMEKGKRKRPAAGGEGLAKGSKNGGGDGGRVRPKRRTGKKDRHSKICTAHGPRDRRMRLSLQIARKFFDLQDMLGFDKASKTIEWLFNKSKAAIKDVTDRSCTSIGPSSPPEEEINGGVSVGAGASGGGGNSYDKKKKKKKEEMGNSNKEGLVSQVRENRERARARARERTKEKLMKQKEKMEQNPSSTSKNNLENLRVDQVQNVHDNEQPPLEDQMASVAIIEKFLTASSSCIFDFHHEDQDHGAPNRVVSCDPMMGSGRNPVSLLDFPGNWMTENARISTGYGAVVSSDDAQVQDPNFEFMGRTFNHTN